MNIDIDKVDFEKMGGLVPAIIQDHYTDVVLMQGFMDKEALKQTINSGKVCFFSRSKQRLWTKGEESGNFLLLKSIASDCDNDSLLIKVQPQGPVCHKGTDTCWNEANTERSFIYQLEKVLADRKNADPKSSYTASLFSEGINKVAQKVGEEAVELVIEAKDDDSELFLNEAADLMYHYMVLLQFKGFKLEDVENILKSRHK